MYQCMAYNDLDTRYSSGQLRVLGDTKNNEKWRPSFAKHPLEEKMFAAEGGNITIKYAYHLALTPNFTCNWFGLFRRNLCCRSCPCYHFSQSLSSKTTENLVNFQPNNLYQCLAIHNVSYSSHSYQAEKSYTMFSFDRIITFLSEVVYAITTKASFLMLKVDTGWDFYNFFFPKTPLQCMFAFDTSLLTKPIVINLLFSKSLLKLLAKVFLKNYFSKQVYKKYFKLIFKMLFRNLPKACMKLVFKQTFKIILNIFAKIYFCLFLIYLISRRRQRKPKNSLSISNY